MQTTSPNRIDAAGNVRSRMSDNIHLNMMDNRHTPKGRPAHRKRSAAEGKRTDMAGGSKAVHHFR